jgi:DHA1 family tetracycline resistance protein-like MFS transporter
VGPILHTRFFYGLAFAMFTSIFSLYAAGGPLNLSPQSTGFVLAYVGVLSAIVQGFAIGKLAKRYPEVTLMLASAVAMVVGFFLWGLVPNVLLLLIVLLPLSIGGGVMNTILSSVLTKAVPGEEVGGTLGLATSVESSTRVIAPALGGFLLAQFGAWGPALFSALMMLWVSTFIWRRFVVNPDPPLDEGAVAAPIALPSH